jgi:hypothetical protein
MTVLTCALWDSLSSAQREEAARAAIARDLRFRFRRLIMHSLGDQQHEMAHFDGFDSDFVLVPGGTVLVGYDHARPHTPSEDQRRAFDRVEREFGVTGEKILAEVLRPLRSVELGTFLVEVRARPVGPVRSAEPIQAFGRRGDRRPITRAQVVQELASIGLRLPTSDEWEYAERGRARTLFRWGDECPLDVYPSGNDTAARQPFRDHRAPNAFGLAIGRDPYDWECVAGEDVVRGGDSGSSCSGGAGFLLGWLTLASAFVSAAGRAHGDTKPFWRLALRRACSVPA